jgi:sugar-specific transcriptional regulator TrmB
MFTKIFRELNLAELTERVFNELVSKGPSTARQLAERLALPRPSVYDHLKILIQKGLITEKNQENKKIFLVDDLKNISELLGSKIKDLETEKKEFEKVLPTLLGKTSFIEPQIKFYSGKEGVKQVLNHIMWNSHIETVLMWPMSEMMKVLGSEYLEELNKKRVKRNIFLRVVWPKDKALDTSEFPYLDSGEDNLRDLRIAPEGMTWNMGYWMYEDKVAFLSSEKEGFGFVVHSHDFAQLLKVQFDQIWKASTPISNKK